jgi:hypothetical protein
VCNHVVDAKKAVFRRVVALWKADHVLARVSGKTAHHGLEMGLIGQGDCQSNSADTRLFLDLPLRRALLQSIRSRLGRHGWCLPKHSPLLAGWSTGTL